MSAVPPDPTRPTAAPPPGFAPTPPSADPSPARWTVDAGRYWAGAAATAVVAALVGVVGVIVFEQILDLTLVVSDPLGTKSTMAAFAIGGALAAIAAAGLLHALVVTTPRPRAFFGWIVLLVTTVVTLLPLSSTADLPGELASGGVHLVVGVAIWSLLSGVLSMTIRHAQAT
jgi:hypothetical protein